jgi:WD40 repeat protein
MSRDPAQRYATAGALGEDLWRFLEDRPIRARRVSVAEHLARWARRNKGLAAALATVGLLLVTIAIGSTIAAVWYQEAATREARHHQAARKQSEDLRRKDYVYRLALADREIDASNLSAAADLLGGCPEELRDGFEYRFVRRRAHLDLPRFKGVQGDVVSLDYSLDGKWLFAAEGVMYGPKASDHAAVVKRDAKTGEIAGKLSVAGGISSIDVSPDGVWIAIGVGYFDFGPPFSPKGEVALADTRTLKIHWQHPAPGPWWANAVAFSPDSSNILVGYGSHGSPMRKKSGSAEVLARATGHVLRSFPGLGPEEIGYGDVAFHPDGRTVALGSYERIELYDLDSQEPIEVISTMQRSSLYALAFSPDGSQLASAGWGRTIHLWDTKTRKLLRRLDGHLGFILDLGFSPDGRFLASASEDRSVRLWNVETGDLDAVFHGHAFHALSVAWHPAGLLLASGGLDDAIKLWDVRASRPIIKWHFGWPNGLAFDPSSNHGVLATQGHGEAFNHRFRLWNPTTGEPIDEPDSWDPASVTSIGEAVRVRGFEMPTANALAAAAARSRDGKYLAWLDKLHTIRVREGAKGKVVRSLEDEAEAICILVLTPDGNYLISGGQLTASKGLKGTVACWDVKAGRVKWRRALGGEWIDVAMSPDGRRIAVTDGSTGQLALLDVSSGEVVATMASDPELAFSCCAFDPGGTRLAVGCSDPDLEFGFVKVLDVATGRELLRLTGHTARVNSVAFSPDGRRLASGSLDRTIKLWDTSHGDEVLTLSGHTQGVLRVAFSRDGNLLASGSNDRTVRIWDGRPLHEPGGP